MIWKLCLSHPEDIGDGMNLQLEKRYGCFTMMIHQRSDQARPKLREVYEYSTAKRTKRSIRSLGFDVYSRMHPWVTKVVCEQGIDRLMAILQIHRETGGVEDRGVGAHRIHSAFRGGGRLNANQRAIADGATACEILRLVNFYKKKA